MSKPLQKTVLFREQAIAARFQRSGSAIMVTTPVSSRIIALTALVLAAAIIGLVGWGKLARTVAVSGTLVPEGGVIRVFSPQPGIVIAKRLKFGETVQRGQALYSISSDRNGVAGSALAAQVSTAIQSRIRALRTTIETNARLQALERDRLTRQKDVLTAQLQNLVEKSLLQKATIEADQAVLARKAKLWADRLVPVEQFEQSERQLANDKSDVIALHMDIQRLRQTLVETQSQLDELPFKQKNQEEELQRQIAAAEADFAQNEMRREIVVAAPESGTVSADLAEIGQTVTTGSAMAVIAPRNADLVAHLLIPSSGIGFIKVGQAVSLRYQAFPYQKFGVYAGKVRSISEVALSGAEMEALHVPIAVDEPIYRVTVTLDQQTVVAFGQPQKLRAGMLVDAEISAETRRVYEWIFEPVYALRGAGALGGGRT